MTTSLPTIHPELGKPSTVYSYRDANGNVYAAVYRFDGPDGKTYRPWDAIRKTWNFPDNSAPYNSEILDHPDYSKFPIVIVEGEKCADLLGKFGISGITSFGGSGSSGKTDWSVLKNRNVIIWPDNDEPGFKYAEALKVTLRSVGLKSLRICNVNPSTLRNVLGNTLLKEPILKEPVLKESLLKQVGSGFLKEIFLKENEASLLKETHNPITSIENLPKGWDVADAIAEGWTKEHTQAFLDQSVSIENDPVPIETPANDNWAEPDMSFLYRKNEPPAFPIEVFSPPIADWLLKTAEGRAAPVDYVAGTLLSSAAALIGNSRKVSPWEDWTEPSILWIALVGSPSSGKSPAMDPVLDQIKNLEADEVPGYEEGLREFETAKLSAVLAKSEWEKDVKTANDQNHPAPTMPESALEPDMPQRPRLVIRDATTEALCLALQSQPKGLLMHRDELAGWFAGFDRYNSGKGGDRAFWLECFGAKAFTQDRVKNGANPITVPNLSASIIGSIQPDRLESLLMKGDDDGLSSRFLYIYPRTVERRRPRLRANNQMIERALRRLHGLEMDIGENHRPIQRVIGLSGDASDTFEAWWRDIGKEGPENESEGKLGGWRGKLPGIALRLSLVLTYLDWASSYDAPEPHEVDYLHISRAIHLIDSYLAPMAEHAFGITAKTETDQNALRLANWILETKPERISVRDMQRGKGPFPSNTKAEEVKAACLELSGLNWLKPDYVRHGANAGRTQTAFLINPNLWNDL